MRLEKDTRIAWGRAVLKNILRKFLGINPLYWKGSENFETNVCNFVYFLTSVIDLETDCT